MLLDLVKSDIVRRGVVLKTVYVPFEKLCFKKGYVQLIFSLPASADYVSLQLIEILREIAFLGISC